MEMKIGVLSDSHVRELAELPQKLVDELSGMDLIVHAGDYTGKGLVDGLRTLGEFRGVYGNMDPPEIRAELSPIEVFEVVGFKIGLIHPSEGGPPFQLEQRLRKKFDQIDIIIYGHSHQATSEVRDKILYFNPGSAVGKHPAISKTYGILELGSTIKSRIKKF